MPFSNGDSFPEGVELMHVPIDMSSLDVMDPLVCARPVPLKVDDVLSKLAGSNASKLTIVAAPGSFTPACTENHIPGFLLNLEKFKSDKGVGAIIFMTFNDAFVVNAWGKLLLQAAKLQKNGDFPQIYFASDDGATFSGAHGMKKDNGRLERYALVVDAKDRKVKYMGMETKMGVSVSGADEVLKAKL